MFFLQEQIRESNGDCNGGSIPYLLIQIIGCVNPYALMSSAFKRI